MSHKGTHNIVINALTIIIKNYLHSGKIYYMMKYNVFNSVGETANYPEESPGPAEQGLGNAYSSTYYIMPQGITQRGNQCLTWYCKFQMRYQFSAQLWSITVTCRAYFEDEQAEEATQVSQSHLCQLCFAKIPSGKTNSTPQKLSKERKSNIIPHQLQSKASIIK